MLLFIEYIRFSLPIKVIGKGEFERKNSFFQKGFPLIEPRITPRFLRFKKHIRQNYLFSAACSLRLVL